MAEKPSYEELLNRVSTFQEYIDLAGVIFVAINTEGNVTHINKKGCEVLGYKEEEIVGKNWFDHFIPERFKDEVKGVSESLLSEGKGEVNSFENPVVTRHGEERLISWHNALLRNEKGDIIGHLSSGTDITERKQAEERLRQYESIVSCSPICWLWLIKVYLIWL